MILKLYLQDNLPDMWEQGEFVESGQHDILTEALGTPEHLGRIKTKGEYVTQLDVFKKLLGGFKSSQESHVLLERERKRDTEKRNLRQWKIASRHRKVGGNESSWKQMFHQLESLLQWQSTPAAPLHAPDVYDT